MSPTLLLLPSGKTRLGDEVIPPVGSGCHGDASALPDQPNVRYGGVVEEAATEAVLADVAEDEPPELVAVTTTSIVSPTSELCRA
jgi:hypothetical protein